MPYLNTRHLIKSEGPVGKITLTVIDKRFGIDKQLWQATLSKREELRMVQKLHIKWKIPKENFAELKTEG